MLRLKGCEHIVVIASAFAFLLGLMMLFAFVAVVMGFIDYNIGV